MVKKLEQSSGNIIGFEMSGKLHDDDYKVFVPAVEEVLKKAGRARILASFHDFHGWDLHAAWDDLKFGSKHVIDIEKIALVGDKQWEQWMAKLCKPFTVAKVKYFDAAEIETAWQWLREPS